MNTLQRLRKSIEHTVDTVRTSVEPSGDVYRATIGGFEWHIPVDDEGQALWCKNFHETHERYLERLAPGDTVLEVGAATGEYTVEAAKRIAPGGELHTFEVEPKNVECLHKNLAAHGVASDVVVEELAVSDSPADGLSFAVADSIADHRFDPEMDGEMNPREADEYETITVDATTIDDYCAERGIESIDVLKLTVNGHEGTILEGATEMLPSTEYVFSNYPYDDVEAVTDEFGFEVAENRDHDKLGDPYLYVNNSVSDE